MDNKQLLQIAYHEAGHAVVAVFLEYARKPKKVTIIPVEGESLGHVLSGGYSKNFQPEAGLTIRQEKQIEHDVIVLLSGFYAEKKFTGRRNRIGASADYRNAVDLAHWIVDYADNELFSPFFKCLCIRARRMVETRWTFIEILAKELLKQKTIKRKEIYNILFPEFKHLND